ncbi:MAG: nitrate reductase, partial [Actinomycetota bacterium]|nr:nitrate reductase [Actinomycetota bacterium]
MDATRTTCPYCGVGCGLVAGVQEGRLTVVEGDALHPVNRGATCQKPLALPEAVHAPDRATVPLVRDHQDERWRSVGWSAAMRRVAARLREVIAQHGPGALAFYLSGQLLTEDYYVASKLAKGFIGTNNVDANSRLCMSSAVSGHQGAFGADGPPASYADLDRADCIVLLGANAAACHPIVWARIRRRQAEGAQVIVVDPRRTETAQAADLHLPVRPGGDLALLNAMLGVLAREELLDEPFLARRTEGATEALAVAAQWPPERAQEECGVEAASIEDAARRFGRAPRAMVLWSMGANQSTVGTLKNRALINLCLATGNLGRPGCGPLSLTGQPNAMGGREVGGLCAQLPGYRFVADPEHRAEMRRLWSLPPDAPGIAPEPGLAATEMADALHDGRVRAVWICGSNPVASQPDPERFAAGLRAADLVVVADAHFPTETSALAHVALPAAAWPEKEGTMTNSERRVSLVRRALPPPGQALADWEMLARLGRALGHRGAFGWRTSAAVYAEYVTTTAGRPCDVSGLSHERLRREGPRQWPCPARRSGSEGHPGTERLYASGPFPSPTGRARLAPTPHAAPLDAPDGDHPLVLATGRVASQWHTMTRTGHSAKLREQEPEPFVELHPLDAQRAGVCEGERVRLVSRRGHTHMRARVTDGVPAGVAFAPFHWGAAHLPPGDAPLNELVGVALDPTSKQAELKATAVRVEPAAGRRPEPRSAEG